MSFGSTYGSWSNWIEAEFAALRYFALNGTDHRTHTEQNTATGRYIRYGWDNPSLRESCFNGYAPSVSRSPSAGTRR